MATQLGQGQQLDSQGQAQQQPGAKGDVAPVLQQLNLTALRVRTQALHTNIGRILHSFHTNPPTKWSEVLGHFAMINVDLLNLVDDIKPILRMYVVYPKNVNAENAPILPIMLSSKLLPEMEAEEAAMKEQMIGGITNLPVPLQSEKLQRQIEAVRTACDVAEKVMTEARKVYGLGTRQGPVALATLDKVLVTRIAEQERLLRAATNGGEGLRLPPDQNQQPAILPQHLSAAFATTRDGRASSYPGADGGYAKASAPVLPPSGLRSSGQQQATQLGSRVQTPSQSIGVGGAGLAGSSPPQLPYMVNSPRSGSSGFNVSSPQQSQTQQQSQLAMLQRTQAQQKQLQRQQQMQAQLQQQQHHLQQQQQLRHPATPPIPQAQPGSQLQPQVGQPLLQQQKQQQSQNRLTQQLAHHQQAQLQQQVLQLQQERQHAMQVSQQQNLQQQLQSSQLQAAQNAVQQASQVRPQIGQQGSSMSNLYGSGTHNMLTSNVMGAMSQSTPSQSLLQQRIQQQFQQGNISTNQLSANQPQQNASSMLSDSWGTGTGTQLPQNSGNLGLPLQQQQLPQTNYMNMFNNPAQTNFGQNRQPPPS